MAQNQKMSLPDSVTFASSAGYLTMVVKVTINLPHVIMQDVHHASRFYSVAIQPDVPSI